MLLWLILVKCMNTNHIILIQTKRRNNKTKKNQRNNQKLINFLTQKFPIQNATKDVQITEDAIVIKSVNVR